MVNWQAIEVLIEVLQDINNNSLLFGGKVIVFGGDFRQVLPVVPRAEKEEIINTSLVTSYLWPSLIKIKLTQNMRARLDPVFSNYLLNIGNGIEPENNDDTIKLPPHIIIPYEDDTLSLKKLIDVVFLDIINYANNVDLMINRDIWTPKNDYVDDINKLLLQEFLGDPIKYYSFNETKR